MQRAEADDGSRWGGMKKCPKRKEKGLVHDVYLEEDKRNDCEEVCGGKVPPAVYRLCPARNLDMTDEDMV